MVKHYSNTSSKVTRSKPSGRTAKSLAGSALTQHNAKTADGRVVEGRNFKDGVRYTAKRDRDGLIKLADK